MWNACLMMSEYWMFIPEQKLNCFFMFEAKHTVMIAWCRFMISCNNQGPLCKLLYTIWPPLSCHNFQNEVKEAHPSLKLFPAKQGSAQGSVIDYTMRVLKSSHFFSRNKGSMRLTTSHLNLRFLLYFEEFNPESYFTEFHMHLLWLTAIKNHAYFPPVQDSYDLCAYISIGPY